jgi:peptidoglycan-N-acetylglucosamine deacetylase
MPKKVTFSFDDGVTQDIRLIEMMNRYGVRSTFNLNFELLGRTGDISQNGITVTHNKVKPGDVKSIYEGHEIASHTLTHPLLTELNDTEVIRQVETDRLRLSELAEYEIVGFAYPGGGVNYSAHAAEVIKNNTGVKYARTTKESHNFNVTTGDELYTLLPTARHRNIDALYPLFESFMKSDDDNALFCIWGHSYELDLDNAWDKFEEFLKFISSHKGIEFVTNKQALL